MAKKSSRFRWKECEISRSCRKIDGQRRGEEAGSKTTGRTEDLILEALIKVKGGRTVKFKDTLKAKKLSRSRKEEGWKGGESRTE